MRVSVVIPTRDKASLLDRTLTALEGQRIGRHTWQAVVVNDHSSDGTDELLARRQREWGERMLVVRPGRNVGRAAARNLGARAADGDLLLFLDDDIIAPPGLIAAHLAAIDERNGYGTIGLVRTDPAIVDAPHFRYIDTRGAAKVAAGTVPARYFVTQNASVPREDFLAVGGFDERFSAYGYEDMELAFRLEDRRGVRFAPVREPVPLHVHHHTLGDWLRKKREGGRSSLLLLARLHPARIAEMRLDWVIDAHDSRPTAAARAFRILNGPFSAAILRLAAGLWPTRGASLPLAPRLHERLLDLLVICHLRLGVRDGSVRSD